MPEQPSPPDVEAIEEDAAGAEPSTQLPSDPKERGLNRRDLLFAGGGAVAGAVLATQVPGWIRRIDENTQNVFARLQLDTYEQRWYFIQKLMDRNEFTAGDWIPSSIRDENNYRGMRHQDYELARFLQMHETLIAENNWDTVSIPNIPGLYIMDEIPPVEELRKLRPQRVFELFGLPYPELRKQFVWSLIDSVNGFEADEELQRMLPLCIKRQEARRKVAPFDIWRVYIYPNPYEKPAQEDELFRFLIANREALLGDNPDAFQAGIA